MFRKAIFSIVAGLLIAVGALAASASSGRADPGFTASTLAVGSGVDASVLDVKMQCGPWNNWCHSGGGGGGSCLNFGGVQLCSGGGGNNCHWYNGVKYCDNGGGGGGGSYEGNCIWHHGYKYCDYKHRGDCIWRDGDRYCTGDQ